MQQAHRQAEIFVIVEALWSAMMAFMRSLPVFPVASNSCDSGCSIIGVLIQPSVLQIPQLCQTQAHEPPIVPSV